MTKLSFAAALLSAFALTSALPSNVFKRDIIDPLPENADDIEKKWQPVLDFDTDGCYQTAAIDPSGKLNPGKGLGGDVNGQCRDEPQLDHSNTYSRRRCNNGFCGIMYEYYYEKDQTLDGCSSGPACGHKHDFENIIVFVRMSDQTIVRVAASKHSGVDAKNDGWLLQDGTHVQMVYNKDGPSTHQHRFANQDDVDHPENVKGVFFRAPLVGWLGWPNDGLRDAMNNGDYGAATPKTAEGRFADALRKAGSDDVGLNADGPDEM